MTNGLPPCSVLLLAGGAGVRFGGEVPKQLTLLGGIPLVAAAARTYSSALRVVVTHPRGLRSEIMTAVSMVDMSGIVVGTEGGRTRRASIDNALSALLALEVRDDELVVLHNAASPNTTSALVRRCLEAAAEVGAAQAFVPSVHTTFRRTGDRMESVLPRGELGHTVDPTVYRLDVLQRALDTQSIDRGEMTLDLVRRMGQEISIVESEPTNVKITTPLDLALLESLSHG